MPPNVVYIDCHDLGDWLGCYGRPWLDTPHLDALAAQGARFGEHIAAAPICMPSRAAIYSGLMPHELGVTGQEALQLHDDAPPLAARFRDAGYRTVLCGRLMVLNAPAEMGFTEHLESGQEEQAETAAAFLEAQGSTTRAGTASVARHGGTLVGQDGPAPARERPFLLSVSFTRCHRPFGDRYDPEVVDRIEVPPYLPDTDATRRDLATLAWQIHELDRRVGLILAALGRAGLADHTLVVFTTEHGPAIARAKHTTYDSGLRTALLLRLPGVIPAGTVVDTMTSNVDLLPTVTDLCGLPAGSARAASAPPRPDTRGESGSPGHATACGMSWAPLLTAADTGAVRAFAFSEFNWGRRSGCWYYTPSRVIRSARYKLIRSYRRIPIYVDSGWLARYAGDHETVQRWYGEPLPDVQLFDLQEDPFELRNRAGDPALAAIEADLAERLDRHLQTTSDPILTGPVANRAGEPDVPQWLPEPGGGFRLISDDPADPGEASFT
jgi:arylsulfatase A-like enzyme